MVYTTVNASQKGLHDSLVVRAVVFQPNCSILSLEATCQRVSSDKTPKTYRSADTGLTAVQSVKYKLFFLRKHLPDPHTEFNVIWPVICDQSGLMVCWATKSWKLMLKAPNVPKQTPSHCAKWPQSVRRKSPCCFLVVVYYSVVLPFLIS